MNFDHFWIIAYIILFFGSCMTTILLYRLPNKNFYMSTRIKLMLFAGFFIQKFTFIGVASWSVVMQWGRIESSNSQRQAEGDNFRATDVNIITNMVVWFLVFGLMILCIAALIVYWRKLILKQRIDLHDMRMVKIISIMSSLTALATLILLFSMQLFPYSKKELV